MWFGEAGEAPGLYLTGMRGGSCCGLDGAETAGEAPGFGSLKLVKTACGEACFWCWGRWEWGEPSPLLDEPDGPPAMPPAN